MHPPKHAHTHTYTEGNTARAVFSPRNSSHSTPTAFQSSKSSLAKSKTHWKWGKGMCVCVCPCNFFFRFLDYKVEKPTKTKCKCWKHPMKEASALSWDNPKFWHTAREPWHWKKLCSCHFSQILSLGNFFSQHLPDIQFIFPFWMSYQWYSQCTAQDTSPTLRWISSLHRCIKFSNNNCSSCALHTQSP